MRRSFDALLVVNSRSMLFYFHIRRKALRFSALRAKKHEEIFVRNISIALVVMGNLLACTSPSITGPTTLKCSETVHDASGNNAHGVPQYFIFEEESFFRSATVRWENMNVDLSLTTYNALGLEGTGNTKALMPLPKLIDQCVNAGLIARPELRTSDGEVNYYLVLECKRQAKQEVSVHVQVTINRLTGDLKIIRRQDSNRQHDTESHGSCDVSAPLF